MKDLKKLLKVVKETKEKREKEYISKCVQQLEKNGRLFDSLKSSEMFELGKLLGRIEEKEELEKALERMIDQKESETKADAKFEQSLKEIEEVMNTLPLLVVLGILENEV